MRAKPVVRIVVPFVDEAHGDAPVMKRPQLLDQSVLEFLVPLAVEKGDDGRAPGEELGAIAPGSRASPRLLGGTMPVVRARQKRSCWIFTFVAPRAHCRHEHLVQAGHTTY